MYNINKLKSINKSSIIKQDSIIIIKSPSQSDFFNSPILKDENISITNNSPFYYENIKGDFTISVKVKNNFTHNYDAGAIFIYESDLKWIKLAYEKTDFETNAIVSVITKETSDDANGVNLNNDWVWLMVSRKDNSFGLHYSIDGKKYYLVRIFRLEMIDELKVGITAQSPTGPDSVKIFSELKITRYSLDNLREANFKNFEKETDNELPPPLVGLAN